MFDINNISYKNDKTWRLIQSGRTCGIFQLESYLGQEWAARIKPSNITELSALVALLRPACLQSGQTELYYKIKSGLSDKLSFDDEDVDEILTPTLSVILYQETLMRLGELIAWKDLPKIERLTKVDSLRISISKKKSKMIEEIEPDFVNGCIKNGKSEELARSLFDVIKKAGRYAFNYSHAAKYAHYSYKTAYLKANYTLEFYTIYLSFSRHKIKPKDELRNLIYEARLLNVYVLPPIITEQNPEFKIISSEKRQIRFGLSHIKNVGGTDAKILTNENIDNWTKLFMANLRPKKKLRMQAVIALISCGACDQYGIPRSLLLEVFRIIRSLSKKEQDFICQKLPDLESIYEFPSLLEKCANCVSVKKRIDVVLSEAQQIDLYITDSYSWKANREKEYLGLPMTCSAIDDKMGMGQLTCEDCQRIENNFGIQASIDVTIDSIKKFKTKRGQNPGQDMAILDVSDKTGSMRVACFPGEFAKYGSNLYESTVYNIVVRGTRNQGWSLNRLAAL